MASITLCVPKPLPKIIQMGSMSKCLFSFLSQVFSFIGSKYNQMLKLSSPYATLHFNSNVCIKTWQLTTHHQTYPYRREIKIRSFRISHTCINKHKNYKMINSLKKFQTHIFSSIHSILGMNMNIITIVHDC